MIKKGDELQVNVLELSSEGKGVSKLEDGFVVFSTGTLPGDEAIIKILKKKTAYAEANLIEITKPSTYRIPPRCRFFGVCGGCKIQNYEYEKQVEYKTNVVMNALQRIGGFEVMKIDETVKCDDIFYYRNKMEFSFSDDEWLTEKDSDIETENFALGLHVPKFHSKIINIDECFLQSEFSNTILNFSRDFFKSRNVSVYSTKTQSGFLRFLIIRESKNIEDFMVNLITYDFNKDLMEEYSQLLRKNFPFITTIINSVTQKKAQVATGESENILFGSGFIYEKLKTKYVKDYMFKISPQSFFQTNTIQAEKLFNTLVDSGEFNKDDKVLDLYCGAGSISIFISDLVCKVTGVEIVNAAIDDAVTNAGLNNIRNVEFFCFDIKEFLERSSTEDFNKLILDPPRSGLHPKICEILSYTNFERIIYVSCNPHTQARDLQIMCSNGKYKIAKVIPVDMFPHTYHIEDVVSLVRT